ncbi:MAG: sigma-70 family RNA polymerase sigma factor [Bryobacterales bacterium]|nr:sigma-70 family RNA polymerase sigma factor [Bryobacterales bacterium]
MEHARSEQQELIAQAVTNASNGTLSGPEQLVQAFYPELKRIAMARMRREAVGHPWQPTELVNELYLELLKVNALRPVKPKDSREKLAFLSLAGLVMRWLLVRETRRASWKAVMQELPPTLVDGGSPDVARLTELDDLLAQLAAIDPQLRRVVELRVFEGLSVQECSERLNCSLSTITRNWRYAKRWLQSRLGGPLETDLPDD